MKKIITLLALIGGLNASSFAQKTNDANLKILEQKVRDFAKHLTETSVSKSIDKAMGVFHPSYKNDITIYDLGGKHATQQRDFVKTRETYTGFTSQGSTVEYKIGKILGGFAGDSLGYISFTMEYSLYRDGLMYRRGTQESTWDFVKWNNDWWATKARTHIIYREVKKATCPCTLFTKKENEYAIQLEMPDGDGYSDKFHAILFKEVKKGQKEVIVDGAIYILNEEGKVQLATPNRQTIELKTNKNLEVIAAILKDIHGNQCFNVKYK
jgi:hypothetical protein